MREKMTEETARQTLFEDSFDCCQTVFSYISEDLGLDEEDALLVASAFGGGMFHGDTCGCVTGALMALGLRYGFNTPRDFAGKKLINEKATMFQKIFNEKCGSLYCRDLIGYDSSIPEELAKALEKGVIEKKCPGYVTIACGILDEIID